MDDVERKLKEMAGSRVMPLRAHYYAPAGFPGRRTGWALYDANGLYAGETLAEKPSGLTPHTKAIARIKRMITEDAPKRRARG